jgi:chemotaxis protein methyltransferase CheR
MKRCAGGGSARWREADVPPDSANQIAAASPAYEALESLLLRATGNTRLLDRNGVLPEKLQRRLRRTGLSTLESYLDLLSGGADGPKELDALIAELTVGETSFFRHPEQFDLLRDVVLPDCLKRKGRSKLLRIWSAGCANGAEAYSVAILVQALLGVRAEGWQVSIVGSDISRAALAEAERGIFSDWTLRDMSETRRRGFFASSGSDWAIKSRYRQNLRFVHHNLISEEYPSFHKNIFGFDIILCRNVMIYFDDRTNADLARKLDSVLVEGGWLLTAPADFNPHLFPIFQTEGGPGGIVYRKKGVPIPALPAPEPASARAEAIDDTPRPRRPQRQRPASIEIDEIIDAANRGDWTRAEKRCAALLKRDAYNAQARYYHALVLIHTGRTRDAERELKRALYADRDFALAHYQLGLLRKNAGDARASRRAFCNVMDLLALAPPDMPVSARGDVSADELRTLASQQIQSLGRRP